MSDDGSRPVSAVDFAAERSHLRDLGYGPYYYGGDAADLLDCREGAYQRR